MSRIKIDSFESLAIEFTQQLDGTGSMSLHHTKRMDIETTDSVITNIMPCSFPNPEQVMENLQEKLSRRWESDLSIREAKNEYIRRMMAAAY
jgi:hypothetical protein